MADRFARTPEEVRECIIRARTLTDLAENEGLSDQPADAIYEFGRWLLGDDDTHPFDGYLEDDDDADMERP